MIPSQRYQQQIDQGQHQPDPGQAEAMACFDALHERLLQVKPGGWLKRWKGPGRPVRGMYLWGGVGRGKTWMMDLFYEGLPFAEKRREHFHRFMQQVHAGLEANQGRSDPLQHVAAQMAKRLRLLCLDEFQVTDIGDAVILAQLLRGLFANGVSLVTTSNVEPDNLYRDGVQRASFLPAIELLKTHTEVHQLGGGRDFRLEYLTHAPTYLVGLDEDSRARLEAEFLALAPAGVEERGQLRVHGRDIPFLRRSDDLIWFDFADLCGGPRSQADYIEIARCHHTVMVSGIPALASARDDWARRLIYLVDEFYDRNVKLVLQAAVPCERLYNGERLAFEFQRTGSRLQEMQSAEYLAKPHRP